MSRRAFTLLEVMLALALVGGLAASVLGFFFQIGEHREAIWTAGSRQQGVGAFFDRLETDLLSGLASGVDGGAGIAGSSSRLTVLSRGVWLPALPGRAGTLGDLQGTEYAFDRGAGAVRLRRWAAVDSAGGETGEAEALCDGVALLRFRYYDGSRWASSFDSAKAGTLPVAIEAAIWFGGIGPEEQVEEGAADAGADASETPSRPIERAERARRPSRDPDRVRLIIVPDGPVEAWKESR